MILTKLTLYLFLLQITFASSSNKLMIFLLDGFRWDYFSPGLDLPGFNYFINNGVKAEYMTPVYPTLTFPNLYSIVTGLYPEHHGMTENFMFDKEHGTVFSMGKKPDDYKTYWWDEGEPLWVTAERQKLRTAWYFWAGTQVNFGGIEPYKSKQWTGEPPTMDDLEWSIRSGINDFVNESVSVVGIYVELVDALGHSAGPSSPSVLQAIRAIDSKLEILRDELEKNNLTDEVNIMMMSDHGMTAVSIDKTINITTAIERNDLSLILDMGSCTSIWPAPNKDEKVYNALKNFHPHLKVYRKDDIPNRFHLKNHTRVPPIFLQADLPWGIITFDTPPDMLQLINGLHGYDNEEEDMRGIFIAKGPDFYKGRTIKPFVAVELYEVMCRILNITSAKNDGHIANVESMFAVSTTSDGSKLNPTASICTLLSVLVCALSVTSVYT